MKQQRSRNPDASVLDAYLTIFAPYADQLSEFKGREREHGGRFALLFRQVARLLMTDSAFNQRIPKMYRVVAQRYLDREPDTVRHFSYEDNRHFFLAELREWLAVHERGRRLRERARVDAPD
ncbi:MAG: hypothetical protein R3E46_17765 [Sedimenticolaceae bacterium]